MIDQAYFQALPINQHPTFYGSQKEYERQKVARVTGPRETKGKGQ